MDRREGGTRHGDETGSRVRPTPLLVRAFARGAHGKWELVMSRYLETPTEAHGWHSL